MSDLSFQEKGHIYTLDGVELPSVSDLCRFLHREIYKDAPAWRMEAAAERGTAVHKATQELDATGRAEIEEAYLPYLKAYKAFLQKCSVTWTMTEKAFYHPELGYAGTIDRYGQIDGEAALVDIKTTSQLYNPLCRAQTNLYRLLLIANGFPVDRLYILHLKRDGKFRLAHMEQDEPLAYSLITLHNALRKKRRKRNE